MRKVAGWHEAEHILEHLPSDIEQYLLHKVKISSEKEIEKLKKKINQNLSFRKFYRLVLKALMHQTCLE